jgi:hypothetical protein
MANNECLEILKQGIYETHITTRSENKDADYKSYFESEKFKTDLKNGSFGLGAGITIEGIPFNLNANSSDEEINQFQEKIKSTVDFKMSNSFFMQSAQIIPNKDIIEAYKECIEDRGFGFHVSYETTETTITFRVYYSNIDINQKPILEDVLISPSSKLVFQSVKKGEKILNNSESKFVFELANDTREVVFILDTDLTAVSEKAEIKRKGAVQGDLPLGTIISSYLTWNQFQKVTENNKESGGTWKSESSIWSPCDGRSVPNSKFASETSLTSVPELRGLFLRGMNDFVFEDREIVIGGNNERDPEPRKLGSFQIDTFRTHAHQYETNKAGNSNSGTGNDPAKKSFTVATSTSSGDAETRPKNVAICYYIKIN